MAFPPAPLPPPPENDTVGGPQNKGPTLQESIACPARFCNMFPAFFMLPAISVISSSAPPNLAAELCITDEIPLALLIIELTSNLAIITGP